MRLGSFGRRVLLSALVVAIATPAHAARWYENYDNAEKALQKQQWQEAAGQFLQAIQQRSEPGVQVKTYGMNFIDYHPYLKLGIAYYNLGQYDAALQAFDREETAGAIAKSPVDLKNLKAFRQLAQDAKKTAGAGEKDRIARAVSEALALARSLEQEEKLDEAIAALGKGLAADPANEQAKAAMERLRGKVAARESEKASVARFTKMVEEGKTLIASGKYAEASSVLNQALSVKPDPDVRALLNESQSKLKAQLEATRTAESRRTLVSDGLAEATRQEKAGQLGEALAKLQSVLAVDPQNRQAVEAQGRLAKAQADAESLRARTDQVTHLMDEGLSYLQKGRPEEAAARFNRVLALDPANDAAKSHVVEAFNLIIRALPPGGREKLPNLPPLFKYPEKPFEGVENGPSEMDTQEEVRVSTPEFSLFTVILDDQPSVSVGAVVSGEDGREKALGTTAIPGSPISGSNQFLFNHAVSVPLTVGLSKVRIVATDPEKASSDLNYKVRYVRPWYRSPWFYTGLVALLTATAGALQGFRIRRRNQFLKRRFNPYMAGAPVLKEDLFLGREPLMSRVLQTINNNSILLYGERRIGKTSFQHHLKNRLKQLQDPEYEFYPVFIDLQGTPQEKFFATLGTEMFHELGAALDGSRQAPSLEGDGSYPYESFVRDVRDVLKTLRQRTAKKVKLVLLVDEVDELNAYDPRINQKLRSLFMKSFAENLVAVVSGVGIKKHWESEGSPWYNFFEEIEVKRFTPKDAAELIERPIRGIFQLENGVVERIIEMTDCKPYLIQKLCISLVTRMHEERRRKITVADVEAVGRPAEA